MSTIVCILFPIEKTWKREKNLAALHIIIEFCTQLMQVSVLYSNNHEQILARVFAIGNTLSTYKHPLLFLSFSPLSLTIHTHPLSFTHTHTLLNGASCLGYRMKIELNETNYIIL